MENLTDDLIENFDRFIVEGLQQGCVWGLQGSTGWALSPSEKYATTEVMPLWSQKVFAQCHCVDEWSAYEPVAIALAEFLEDWLPGFHEDEVLVGINWNSQMEGEEVEPLDLLCEFESELS